jgi:hypothetical protein
MTDVEREAAMFHNAGPLFAIAQQACGRVTADDREPGQYDAIVAVVFSVLAIEAMLTELCLMTRVVRLPLPASIQTMATLLGEADESRASLELKMHLYSHALRGVAWDKGTAPYQAFASLVDLRNDLVHTKVDRIYSAKVETPGVLKRLRSMNIMAPQEPVRSWIEIVGTKAVAQWACKSTSAIAHAMVDALPEGHFREGALIGFWQLLDSADPLSLGSARAG